MFSQKIAPLVPASRKYSILLPAPAYFLEARLEPADFTRCPQNFYIIAKIVTVFITTPLALCRSLIKNRIVKKKQQKMY